MSADVIRAFLAVPPGDAARAALAAAQRDIVRLGPSFKPVAPENIHLTLVFLGAVFAAQADAAGPALAGTAAEFPGGALEIRGLGCFGRPGAPRVLWAGLRGDLQPLLTLQAALCATLGAAGLAPAARGPFHPHLTLGRLRPGAPARIFADFAAARGQETFGPLDLRRVLLMQSRLTPAGPVYAVRREFPLATTGPNGCRARSNTPCRKAIARP